MLHWSRHIGATSHTVVSLCHCHDLQNKYTCFASCINTQYWQVVWSTYRSGNIIVLGPISSCVVQYIQTLMWIIVFVIILSLHTLFTITQKWNKVIRVFMAWKKMCKIWTGFCKFLNSQSLPLYSLNVNVYDITLSSQLMNICQPTTAYHFVLTT